MNNEYTLVSSVWKRRLLVEYLTLPFTALLPSSPRGRKPLWTFWVSFFFFKHCPSKAKGKNFFANKGNTAALQAHTLQDPPPPEWCRLWTDHRGKKSHWRNNTPATSRSPVHKTPIDFPFEISHLLALLHHFLGFFNSVLKEEPVNHLPIASPFHLRLIFSFLCGQRLFLLFAAPACHLAMSLLIFLGPDCLDCLFFFTQKCLSGFVLLYAITKLCLRLVLSLSLLSEMVW